MKSRWQPQELAAKLPPGSMGWPYVGETLQLYSQDPNHFFASKQKRYGEIFKTHILGYPSVMLGSPEAARFLLVTNADMFKPTYPKSKERFIGPHAIFFHQGDYHRLLRKLVQASLLPEAIKKFPPAIESAAICALESWASRPHQVINVFHEMKKVSFNIGILAVFGHLDSNYKDKLKENYIIVHKGYNSFPTSIPGTAYSKALQARKRINEIISELIRKRKEERLMENGLLGHMLNYKDENGQALSDDQIADNIIGVIFAAQDTTASVLTWLLRYLHDDQKLLAAVKVPPKPNTFMPFGNGIHSCPGNDLAKLDMFIFIHHLVTKYRWEIVGNEKGTQYRPFPVPLHGLPARFWKN